MTEEQRYLFDTFGYLVIPNALKKAQVEDLLTTLRTSTEQFPPIAQCEGPLHWGKIWRDLLDLPSITPLLEEIIGNHGVREGRAKQGLPYIPTFRIDHINVHTHVKKGFAGAVLHGGWKGTGGSQFTSYHDNRFYNGLVSVSFELFDTFPNDGGFGCVPGSHKSNVAMPSTWRDLTKGVPDCVKRISAAAGDAIVFTEALTHGTLPWQVDAPRRTLFYKFSPHGSTWSADYFNPDDFRTYPDIDDRKLAILEPPNARYTHRPTRPAPLNDEVED
ncbi:MAG: mitomycin antibiotics/polyketide fumonisin biosynthesis protein [Gammaproteobacteria bacterium]|nr:mitomycin antibiotics/polyketide fumonisin biosynthesis protein [Gammaproteobacteria bacterium]